MDDPDVAATVGGHATHAANHHLLRDAREPGIDFEHRHSSRRLRSCRHGKGSIRVEHEGKGRKREDHRY
jgi:hypothetical protein